MGKTYIRRLRHVPAPARGRTAQPTVVARAFVDEPQPQPQPEPDVLQEQVLVQDDGPADAEVVTTTTRKRRTATPPDDEAVHSG